MVNVAGGLPMQKPNPAERKFAAIAAANFDFKPVSAFVRLHIKKAAAALRYEPPSLNLTIPPQESSQGLRSKDAWFESREFHRSAPPPTLEHRRTFSPPVGPRTESVELPGTSWIVPPDQRPWVAEFASFNGSLRALDSLLALDPVPAPETEAHSNIAVPAATESGIQPEARALPPPAAATEIPAAETGTAEPAPDPQVAHELKPVLTSASVSLAPLAAKKAKPVQVYGAALTPRVSAVLPTCEPLLLRPRMIVRHTPAKASREQVVLDPVPEAAMALQSLPASGAGASERDTSGTAVLQSVIAADEYTPEAVAEAAVAEPLSRGFRETGITRAGSQTIAPSGTGELETRSAAVSAPTMDEPALRIPTFGLKESGPTYGDVGTKPPEPRSNVLKLVGFLVGALALAGSLFLSYRDSAAQKEMPTITTSAPGTEKDWVLDFSPDPRHPRSISILRSSSDLPNYRVEFEGIVDIGALGWVFRAKDAKNFYVTRLERQKPGSGSALAIVHYAVIGGIVQSRAQKPIAGAVPPGGAYPVRFEISGDRFTTWVQDIKVDDWSDDRLKSGGVGLYSESGERAMIRGAFNVTPLGDGK